MTKNPWESKIIRFGCIGIINTITDITILNILAFVSHVPELIANLFSASISISMSYFLNHHLVFRSKERHTLKKFLHFFILTGFGILAIQSLVIYMVIHVLNSHKPSVESLVSNLHLHMSSNAFELNAGKILAICIAMVWNFSIYHFIIFKHTGAQPEEYPL